MNEPVHYEGYVLFVLINKGTRSQRLAPLLIPDGGSSIRLIMEGDRTFETVKLRPYHKKYCKLTGHYNPEKSVIKVTGIEIASDPLEAILSRANQEQSGEIQPKEESGKTQTRKGRNE